MIDCRQPTRRTVLGALVGTLGTTLLSVRPSFGTTLEVGGPEEFGTALEVAAPGSVLVLAPGDYGSLNLRRLKGAPGAPVTLVAADTDRPPRFERMDLREVAHLVLERLHFDYSFDTEDKIHFRPFTVVNSEDILIRRCLFDGDKAEGLTEVDNGFGWAFGLGVTDVSGFTLEGCEIRDFYRGLVVARSDDVTIRENNLHDLRMDGMNFAQVSLVTIADNHIHDFNRSVNSGDHADMIQFWTNGTDAPSSMITIRGNLLASGRGAWTQSIFMRNEEVDRGRAGAEMFYRTVLIEDNVISNAHLHGITVGETDGLTIRRNTVVPNPVSEGEKDNIALWTPQIRVQEASRNVLIQRNVVAKIAGFAGQPDWQMADNMAVQDRTRIEPGFFDLSFQGDPADPASLRYRPGGPLDGAGIGAARLQP